MADTDLSESGSAFELHRAKISDRRVPAPGIVEALNVIEHIGSGFVPGSIQFARCPRGLERGEEALHRGVVQVVAGAAHRADDAVIGHQPLDGIVRANCSGFIWRLPGKACCGSLAIFFFVALLWCKVQLSSQHLAVELSAAALVEHTIDLLRDPPHHFRF